MRYRALASLLTVATGASLALDAARAEPLSYSACEAMKTERTLLESGDITRALDEGPEWATKNLTGEQLERAKRYVLVDETVRFRCPEREDPNGTPPPLPVEAPNRAEKIKEIEALAKIEAEKQAEALEAAAAESAKQEAARQAEAEKLKAEAAASIGSQPLEEKKGAKETGGARGFVSPEKAAASIAPGAEPVVEKSVLKTPLLGDEPLPKPGPALQHKSAPYRSVPLSLHGIGSGEDADSADKNPVRRRESSAEPVQAVPVDAEQLRAAELKRRSVEQAEADDDSWFAFFRRSLR